MEKVYGVKKPQNLILQKLLHFNYVFKTATAQPLDPYVDPLYFLGLVHVVYILLVENKDNAF